MPVATPVITVAFVVAFATSTASSAAIGTVKGSSELATIKRVVAGIMMAGCSAFARLSSGCCCSQLVGCPFDRKVDVSFIFGFEWGLLSLYVRS